MLIYSLEPRSGAAWQRLPLDQIVSKLIWNPERCHVEALDAHAMLISASSNSKLFGIDCPYAIHKDKALLMAGLPTLEGLPQRDSADLPEQIHNILRNTQPCDLHRRLGGAWSIATYRRKHITAFTDFSGFNSIFYAKGDGLIAVSNKAGLLRPIANRNGLLAIRDINPWALSWLPGTTMVQGHQMLLTG